jgi:hypothetical protein
MLSYDRHHLFEVISLAQVLADQSVVYSKGFPMSTVFVITLVTPRFSMAGILWPKVVQQQNSNGKVQITMGRSS